MYVRVNMCWVCASVHACVFGVCVSMVSTCVGVCPCMFVYVCVYIQVYVLIFLSLYMVACYRDMDPFGEIWTRCRRFRIVFVVDPIH